MNPIETLREFGNAKMTRVPTGIGKMPSWRPVNDIFDQAGSTTRSWPGQLVIRVRAESFVLESLPSNQQNLLRHNT